MGYIKFTTSVFLVALFSLAFIGFVANFGTSNNAGITLDDNTTIGGTQTQINASLYELSVVGGNTSYNEFQELTAESGSFVAEGGGQFKAGSRDMISIMKNVASNSFNNIFGSDGAFSIFLISFLALFGLIASAYFYKAWFGRNPD